MFRRILLVLNDSELRSKLIKIMLILVAARLLAHIPIPLYGIRDVNDIVSSDQFLGLLNTITGGSYGRLSFVMLGIGPYITASIVMQLLGVIIPRLNEIRKEEGQQGQEKINRWTRFVAVPVAALNSWGILQFFANAPAEFRIPLPEQLTTGEVGFESFIWWSLVITSMTAGSIIMMWLGEIITEYKMGNGISLMILAGIASRLPGQIWEVGNDLIQYLQNLFGSEAFNPAFSFDFIKGVLWSDPVWTPARNIALLFITFVITLLFVVFINDAIRRIIIVYSRRGHSEGKSRTMNSVKADLPIKVNMAGVLPAIFAVSIILFPTIISRFFFTANIPQVRETAQSIESFLSSTPSSQGQTGFPLPGSPEASFAGFYTTNDPQELAVAKQNDYTVGQEIFGFTFSTNPEVKNSFFEGTFAEFEAPTAPRLGVLPETIIGWNGVLAYTFFYFILIIFFTYFYTSEIAFKTDEVAENLQKSGAYIPGQKPGEETANYLSYVSNRLNVAGSLFLAIIAVVPMMFSSMQIGDGTLTGVVGGTTLLILVSVSIEALKQIDAQATNVDYEKFSSY